LRFGFVAALVLVAVAAWPAAGGGAKIPKVPQIPGLPKVPKITSYPVTVDAAGYLDFEWTWDDTQPCIPGYAKTVSEELSFELGRPMRRAVQIVGGSVTMPFAIGGEAKTKAVLSGYQTSNYCPPTPRQEEPPAPTCKTVKGKLGMLLLPEPYEDGDIAPLGNGVLVSFIRRGGGAQDPSCLQDRPTLHPLKEEKGVQISTLPLPAGGLTLPLTNSTKMLALKPGQRIQRSIAIGGGCENVTATATASLSGNLRRCTVGGKVVVTIKRTG
jgi:hypothetical protein